MDTILSDRPHGEVLPGQSLCSRKSSYTVLEILGKGSFGKVLKCQNVATAETVAVKIMKNDVSETETQQELSMLKIISVLDPEKNNVVKFLEGFQALRQTCMVFELLDISLFTLIAQKRAEVSLKDIRDIAQQLFEALDALQSLGVVHADVKPDNVMLANHQQRPYKVKLIDFGVATCRTKPFRVIQLCGFRAPECFFRQPVTGAVDMWSVGCVLAFLYLHNYIFPICSDYLCMRTMVRVLGLPDSNVLQRGRKSKDFFTVDKSSKDPKWRLLTPEEFYSQNDNDIPQKIRMYRLHSLKDLTEMKPNEGVHQKVIFVDLLSNLLNWDFAQRITSRKALRHPFITEFPGDENTCSPVTPCKNMTVGHREVTDLAKRPPTNISNGDQAAAPDQPQLTQKTQSVRPAEISPASISANQPQVEVSNTPSPSGSAYCSPASKPAEIPQATRNGGWRNFWLRAGGAAIRGAVGAFNGFSLQNIVPHTRTVLSAAAGVLLGTVFMAHKSVWANMDE